MKIFKESGYTILELMVIIMVIAVLTVMVVPSFSGMFKKNAIAATTNELVGLLQYAKTAAVAHNNPVIVCPFTETTSGSSATYECDDKFADTTKTIGVFLYSSTSTFKDLLREMTVVNSVSITNLSTGDIGKAIAFYPDSSSAIHGIPKKFSKYEDNGAYSSSQLTLKEDDFPVGKGVIQWQIKTKTSTANEKCNVIKVSSIGQSKVEQESCQ